MVVLVKYNHFGVAPNHFVVKYVNKIEDMHKGFKNSDKTVAIIQSNWMQLYPEDHNDIAVNIYIFPDTVITLLANIRQKARALLKITLVN